MCVKRGFFSFCCCRFNRRGRSSCDFKCYILLRSRPIKQSASDKRASSCCSACNTELTTLFIPRNPPWSVWGSGLIHLCLKSRCHVENIISSHLHHCGSDAGRAPACFFSNWIADGTPERISHATITNIHWLIGSIQQLIHCDTLIFLLGKRAGLGMKYGEIAGPLFGYSSLTLKFPM